MRDSRSPAARGLRPNAENADLTSTVACFLPTKGGVLRHEAADTTEVVDWR